MNESINALELERKKVYKKYLTCTIIGWVLLPLDFILLFLSSAVELYELYDVIIGFSLVTMVTAIILIAVGGTIKRKFLVNAKEKLIYTLIRQELGNDFKYFPRGGMPLNTILSQGIYKYPDRYFLEDHIISSYNNVPYEICDCELQEKHETRDKDGNRRVSYVTYFKGRVIKIDFQRDFDFNMKVLENKFSSFSFSKFKKLETEVIEFNKKFDVYVTDTEKGYYFLTPSLIQNMMELEKLFRGSINYSMDGNFFFIYINDSINTLEFNISKPLNTEQLNIIRSQINLPSTIIGSNGS